MLLPPKPVEIAFQEFLKELPPDYHELAYEFRAFTRSRKFKSPAQLLQVVMLYCGLDKALRETAGDFTLLEEQITDTAIHERLKGCGPWLKALLHGLLPAGARTLPGHLRIVVVDGSSIQGPGAEGTDYRLHLALDLVSLTFREVHVTGAEGGERVDRYGFEEGDVVLMDRGYNQPGALLDWDARGVLAVVRLNPKAMPLSLCSEDGMANPGPERLDLAKHLREVADVRVTVPVWLRAQQRRGRGWVHACRLPPEEAEAARRRCRQSARRKGRTPGADTLYLAGWVLVFTTVPPDVLDGEAILALYRARWQVELAIKRLKTVLNLDQLRTKARSALGEVWMYGKLLYALVIERRLQKLGIAQDRLDQPRQATPWRLLKLVRRQVDAWILDMGRWQEAHWPACRHVITERPRQRTLQTLPDRVIQLLDSCRKLGWCAP
jgi:hypothetical protein